MDLYRALTHRKEFDVDLTPEFYLQSQKKLAEYERFIITLVYEGGQPVAGHVASFLGDTCVYLLGATNEAGLKNKSAYLAQWSVIHKAKERGCRFYDLGGIDPENNPGVHHFKKGLGGVDRSEYRRRGRLNTLPDSYRRALVVSGEKVYRLIRRFRTH